MKKILTLLLAFIGCNFAFCQTIVHHDYKIYYNPKIKAPDSTSFNLSPSDVNCGTVTRIDMFASDPLLANGPKPGDFKNPPNQPDSLQIDKGHTRSFKSSACNPTDRRECFYVSGMYAQYHGFNNGDWKEFEEYEQKLALTENIHVINGYIGIQGYLQAGEIIPTYMYKAISHISPKGNEIWDIFIAPNRPWVHGHNIDIWRSTIGELNAKTGLQLNGFTIK